MWVSVLPSQHKAAFTREGGVPWDFSSQAQVSSLKFCRHCHVLSHPTASCPILALSQILIWNVSCTHGNIHDNNYIAYSRFFLIREQQRPTGQRSSRRSHTLRCWGGSRIFHVKYQLLWNTQHNTKTDFKADIRKSLPWSLRVIKGLETKHTLLNSVPRTHTINYSGKKSLRWLQKKK